MIPSYKATVEKAKTALRAWQASPAWADPSQDHVKANELIQSLGDLRLPGVVLLSAAKELDAVLYERLKVVLSSKNTQLVGLLPLQGQ